MGVFVTYVIVLAALKTTFEELVHDVVNGAAPVVDQLALVIEALEPFVFQYSWATASRLMPCSTASASVITDIAFMSPVVAGNKERIRRGETGRTRRERRDGIVGFLRGIWWSMDLSEQAPESPSRPRPARDVLVARGKIVGSCERFVRLRRDL
jgi:hypothetical protein